MRLLSLSLIASLALAGGAAAKTTSADLAVPIHQFIDAFNKGDGKAASANFVTTGVSIIDEVPPFIWRGATAFDTWSHDLAANDAKKGIAGEKVTLGAVTRTEVEGDRAYVVVGATYSFTEHGAPMHEVAQMTYVLRKGADGWKIGAWTWTGPKPSPDAAKSKP
jgi:ketosteroid isomerase-like protein